MKESSSPEITEHGYAIGILCVDDGHLLAVAGHGLSLDKAEQLRRQLRHLKAVILPPGHRLNPISS
jgi:hypothetical protein